MLALPVRALRAVVIGGGLSLLVLGPIGCASNSRPSDVPSTAALETGGQGRLVFVAPTSGTLYISDQQANALVYSGQVHAGDRVVVNPDADHIAINDQVVVGTNVNHDDHKIYLLAGASAPPPVAVTASSMNIPRPEGVPATALLGAQGRDRLVYSSPDRGTVWVVDASTGAVVYRTRVGPGDHIVVDPAKNALLLNGTPAFSGTLPADEYRIFFVPSLSPDAGPAAVSTVEPTGAPAAVVTTQLPAVAPSAVVLSESNTVGTVTATQSGTVWVTDQASGRVIFSGFMRQGDTLIVNPDTGRVTLNGTPVVQPGQIIGRYRVSFLARA